MSGDPNAVLQAAKNQLNECDKEIGAIRAMLRGLGTAEETAEVANELTFEWLNPAGDDAELKLELSSPVEKVFLNAGNAYKATFNGVETGQATLSIGGSGDAASSTVVDVAEFTVQKLQALEPAPEYVTDKDIIGTYQLRITYRPSKKDQREELYELLNKATQRKATAREDLRQAAANMPATAVSTTTSGNNPAVKAGFLNKKSSGPAAPPKWKIWYRRIAVIVPIAKNYVLFGGFLVFSHFRGQHLAIPPPV